MPEKVDWSILSTEYMEHYSIVVVEDDPATRDWLVQLASREPALEVVACVGTLAEGREVLDRYRPRVLLVDLGLPDGTGLDLIGYAEAHHAGTQSLVITVFGDEQHVLAAIAAGAEGYILKDSTANEIARSILQVIGGESPISASIARHLLRRLQKPISTTAEQSTRQHFELTARETEVLNLVAKGFSSAEIGTTLGTSVHTTTSHIQHIYRKLAVRSRSEAVFEAVQLGLIKIDRQT